MLKLADDLKLKVDADAQSGEVTKVKTPPTRGERIWATGLFEGEGTVTIGVRKSDETYRLICTVGSTDIQIINFFHGRWGGWHQPAYGVRRNRKKAWYWTVAGQHAEAFLRSIQPFVVTVRVRRKLMLGLDFRKAQSRLKRVWSQPRYKATRRQIYNEMRVLNRRGVTVDAETR